MGRAVPPSKRIQTHPDALFSHSQPTLKIEMKNIEWKFEIAFKIMLNVIPFLPKLAQAGEAGGLNSNTLRKLTSSGPPMWMNDYDHPEIIRVLSEKSDDVNTSNNMFLRL